jgi:signal transduction histidine kinase
MDKKNAIKILFLTLMMQIFHSALRKAVQSALSLISLFTPVKGFCQNADSIAIENLLANGWNLIYTKPDSAKWFFESVKMKAQDNDFAYGIIMYHNYNAALQTALSNTKGAIENYDQAIAIAKKNNLSKYLGMTYMKKGVLNQFVGEYANAAENYLAAARLLKTNEDRKQVIGLYKNVILTLNNLQQQNQSLQNVLPALKNDNSTEEEIVSILSQKKSTEASFDFPDQTTIRETTGGYMYVVFGGAKFLIADYEILGKYSTYRSVNKIPDGTLSRISNIPFDGTILREFNDGGTVYLMKDKQRHRIASIQVLQFFGGWDALCTVPEHALDQVPDAGDTVTMQNVMTTYNFRKEYEVLIDTLETTLVKNTELVAEVGRRLKEKNNVLQKRKILLYTSFIGIAALLSIGFLLARNFRQKQKLHQQSLLSLKMEEELKQKMAIEKERTRIANDIHDDLGAGLSTLRFLSEKVKRNSFSDTTKNDAEKIVNNSNELVQKMNELIWAMNEKNDTLEDLLFYARSYAAQYGEENNLLMEIVMPEKIPLYIVTGEMRRNIFLTLKESLHNVVKHAAAKKVFIHFQTEKNIFISIKDDGKSFETNTGVGNGLKNMKKRIESVGGTFEIIHTHGVTVNINVPLK